MKNIWTGIFFLGLFAGVFAQQGDPGKLDDRARDKINAARAAYITQRLGLTAKEAERFWPIYREFAEKRMEIRREMDQARTRIQSERSPEQLKEMVEQSMRLRQRELDLEKEYSNRLLATISAQQLMNLRKAEEDFRNLLLQQIQQRQLERERELQMRDKLEQQRRDRNN